MELLDKLLGNKLNKTENNAQTFADWIDGVLENIDLSGVIAVNFNLYEASDNSHHIELIGSDEYDPKNSDWACNEIFTTRDNLFITNEKAGQPWEAALKHFKSLATEYLENGRYRQKILSLRAVGIGFVNGDLEVLHESN